MRPTIISHFLLPLLYPLLEAAMRFFFKPVNPRTIVEHIGLEDEYSITLWRSYFPGMPAPRARSLSIGAVTTKLLRWILSFDQLEELTVDDWGWRDLYKPVSLPVLRALSERGSSRTLKFLRLVRHSFSLSDAFDFIYSFPNIENLHLDVREPFENYPELKIAPPTPPRFTGSLVLDVTLRGGLSGGIGPIVSKLVSTPGGLHFSSIKMVCPIVTDRSATRLVSRCSRTLKSLHVEYTADPVIMVIRPHALGLSRARKLEEIEFRCNRPEVDWIAKTLETVKHRRLRRITICLNPSCILYIPIDEWSRLDLVLAQLQFENSATIRISCSDRLRERAPTLLKTLTSRGVRISHAEDHPYWNYDMYSFPQWFMTGYETGE